MKLQSVCCPWLSVAIYTTCVCPELKYDPLAMLEVRAGSPPLSDTVGSIQNALLGALVTNISDGQFVITGGGISEKERKTYYIFKS